MSSSPNSSPMRLVRSVISSKICETITVVGASTAAAAASAASTLPVSPARFSLFQSPTGKASTTSLAASPFSSSPSSSFSSVSALVDSKRTITTPLPGRQDGGMQIRPLFAPSASKPSVGKQFSAGEKTSTSHVKIAEERARANAFNKERELKQAREKQEAAAAAARKAKLEQEEAQIAEQEEKLHAQKEKEKESLTSASSKFTPSQQEKFTPSRQEFARQKQRKASSKSTKAASSPLLQPEIQEWQTRPELFLRPSLSAPNASSLRKLVASDGEKKFLNLKKILAQRHQIQREFLEEKSLKKKRNGARRQLQSAAAEAATVKLMKGRSVVKSIESSPSEQQQQQQHSSLSKLKQQLLARQQKLAELKEQEAREAQLEQEQQQEQKEFTETLSKQEHQASSAQFAKAIEFIDSRQRLLEKRVFEKQVAAVQKNPLVLAHEASTVPEPQLASKWQELETSRDSALTPLERFVALLENSWYSPEKLCRIDGEVRERVERTIKEKNIPSNLTGRIQRITLAHRVELLILEAKEFEHEAQNMEFDSSSENEAEREEMEERRDLFINKAKLVRSALSEELRKLEHRMISLKLDGVRVRFSCKVKPTGKILLNSDEEARVQSVVCRTRHGKELQCAARIKKALLPLFKRYPTIMLDGELFAPGVEFNDLSGAIRVGMERDNESSSVSSSSTSTSSSSSSSKPTKLTKTALAAEKNRDRQEEIQKNLQFCVFDIAHWFFRTRRPIGKAGPRHRVHDRVRGMSHAQRMIHLNHLLRDNIDDSLLAKNSLFDSSLPKKKKKASSATAMTQSPPPAEEYQVTGLQGFMNMMTAVKQDLLSSSQCPISFLRSVEVSTNDLDKCLDAAVEEKLEGVMIRPLEGRYVANRGRDLSKYKKFQDAEFKIVGVIEGEGKLVGAAASFVLKTKKGVRFQAPLSGTLEYKRAIWKSYKSKPYKGDVLGHMVTVQFFEMTKNGVPRFPTAKSIRGKSESDFV